MAVETEAETQADDAGSSDEGTRRQEQESTRQARVDRRNKELAAELKAARDKLAEHESAAEERASAEERAKNDFAAIEKRYQLQIEKLTREKAESDSWRQERERGDRETALLDSVLEKTGVKDRDLVLGHLLVAHRKKGLDIAPVELTDQVIADAVDAVKTLYPDTFKPRNTASPGPPGTNGTNRPSLELRPDGSKRDPAVVAIGAAYSPKRGKTSPQE